MFWQYFSKSKISYDQNGGFKIFNFVFIFLGYSCALVGDILLQGHLYVTENYIAFHSNVFGYITRVIKLHCFSFQRNWIHYEGNKTTLLFILTYLDMLQG